MNDLTFANHCNEENWQVFLCSNVKTKKGFMEMLKGIIQHGVRWLKLQQGTPFKEGISVIFRIFLSALRIIIFSYPNVSGYIVICLMQEMQILNLHLIRKLCVLAYMCYPTVQFLQNCILRKIVCKGIQSHFSNQRFNSHP